MPRFALLLLGLAALVGCDAVDPIAPPPGATLSVRYTVDGAPAQVTYTDPGGPATVTTDGDWELRFDAPPGSALSLAATSSSGAPVTAVIYLDGTPFRADHGLSVNLSGSTDGYEEGEVEVHGFVEGVGADRVTVLGLTFVVDAQTELLDRDGQPIALSAFALGTFVEAEGRRRSDGLYTATKLKFDDDDGGGTGTSIEVTGPIEALTAGSVTVSGYLFEVDEHTRFLDHDNDPVPFSTFRVGDRAEAEGFTRPDGTHYAEKLKLED